MAKRKMSAAQKKKLMAGLKKYWATHKRGGKRKARK